MADKNVIRHTLYTWAMEAASEDKNKGKGIDVDNVRELLGSALDKPMFQNLGALASGAYTEEDALQSGLPAPILKGIQERAEKYRDWRTTQLEKLDERMGAMGDEQVNTVMRLLDTPTTQEFDAIDRVMRQTANTTFIEADSRAIPVQEQTDRKYNWQSPFSQRVDVYNDKVTRSKDNGSFTIQRGEKRQVNIQSIVQEYADPTKKEAKYHLVGERIERGMPVVRLRTNPAREGDNAPPQYYDLAFDTNTGALMMMKAGSNSAHIITSSMGFELDKNGKNEPGIRRGVGENLKAILTEQKASPTNYSKNGELGGGALYNLVTGTYDERRDLAAQISIPKEVHKPWMKKDEAFSSYPLSVDDMQEMNKYLAKTTGNIYTPVDAKSSFLRNQTNRLKGNLTSKMIDVTMENVTKNQRVVHRPVAVGHSAFKDMQREGFRGGSGGVGPAVGMNYTYEGDDEDGFYTIPLSTNQRGIERERRTRVALTFDRAGFGEGETKVPMGEHIINRPIRVPLHGYGQDTPPPISVGDTWTRTGQAPKVLPKGSTFMGEALGTGGAIPNLSGIMVGNAEQARVRNLEWQILEDAKDDRPAVGAWFATIDTAYSADIGEIKTTSGLKGSNVGVNRQEDPHFRAIQETFGEDVDAIIPMASKDARQSDILVDLFRGTASPLQIAQYSIEAAKELGFSQEETENALQWRSEEGGQSGTPVNPQTLRNYENLGTVPGIHFDNSPELLHKAAALWAKSQEQDIEIKQKRFSEQAFQAWLAENAPMAEGEAHEDWQTRARQQMGIENEHIVRDPDGKALLRFVDYKTRGLTAFLPGDWLQKGVTGQGQTSVDAVSTISRVQPEAAKLMNESIKGGAFRSNNDAQILRAMRANVHTQDGDNYRLSDTATQVRKNMNIINAEDIDLASAEKEAEALMPNATPDEIRQAVLQKLAQHTDYKGKFVQMGGLMGVPLNVLASNFTVDDRKSQMKLGSVGYDLIKAIQEEKQAEGDKLEPATQRRERWQSQFANALFEKGSQASTKENALRLMLDAPGGPTRMIDGLPYNLKVQDEQEMLSSFERNYRSFFKQKFGDELMTIADGKEKPRWRVELDNELERIRTEGAYGPSVMYHGNPQMMGQITHQVSDRWLRGEALQKSGFWNRYDERVAGVSDGREQVGIGKQVIEELIEDKQREIAALEAGGEKGHQERMIRRQINALKGYSNSFDEYGTELFRSFQDIHITPGTVGSSMQFIQTDDKDADGDNEALNFIIPFLKKEDIAAVSDLPQDQRNLISVGDEAGGTYGKFKLSNENLISKFGDNLMALRQYAVDMEKFKRGEIKEAPKLPKGVLSEDMAWESEHEGARATEGMMSSYWPNRNMYAAGILGLNELDMDEETRAAYGDAMGITTSTVYQHFMDKENIPSQAAKSVIKTSRGLRASTLDTSLDFGLSPVYTEANVSKKRVGKDAGKAEKSLEFLLFDMLVADQMRLTNDADNDALYTGEGRYQVRDEHGNLSETRGLVDAAAKRLIQKKDIGNKEIEERIKQALIKVYASGKDAGFSVEGDNLKVNLLPHDLRREVFGAITGTEYKTDREGIQKYQQDLRRYTMGSFGKMKKLDAKHKNDALFDEVHFDEMSLGSTGIAAMVFDNMLRKSEASSRFYEQKRLDGEVVNRSSNANTYRSSLPKEEQDKAPNPEYPLVTDIKNSKDNVFDDLVWDLGYGGREAFLHLAKIGGALRDAKDLQKGNMGIEKMAGQAEQLASDDWKGVFAGHEASVQRALGGVLDSSEMEDSEIHETLVRALLQNQAQGLLGNNEAHSSMPSFEGLQTTFAAKGGTLRDSDMTIVGEEGPEIIIGGRHVLPNEVYKEIFGGASPQELKGRTQSAEYANEGTPKVQEFLEQFPGATYADLKEHLGVDNVDGRNLKRKGLVEEFGTFATGQITERKLQRDVANYDGPLDRGIVEDFHRRYGQNAPDAIRSMEKDFHEGYINSDGSEGSVRQRPNVAAFSSPFTRMDVDEQEWQAAGKVRQAIKAGQHGPAGHQGWARSKGRDNLEGNRYAKWHETVGQLLSHDNPQGFTKAYNRASKAWGMPSLDEAAASLEAAQNNPPSESQIQTLNINNLQPISEEEALGLNRLVSRFEEQFQLRVQAEESGTDIYTRPDFAKNVLNTDSQIQELVSRANMLKEAGASDEAFGGKHAETFKGLIEMLTSEEASTFSSSDGRGLVKESARRAATERRVKEFDAALGGNKLGEADFHKDAAERFLSGKGLDGILNSLQKVSTESNPDGKSAALHEAKQLLKTNEYFVAQGMPSEFEQSSIRQISGMVESLESQGFSALSPVQATKQEQKEANDGTADYRIAGIGAAMNDFAAQVSNLTDELPNTNKELRAYVGTFKGATQLYKQFNEEFEKLQGFENEGSATNEQKALLDVLRSQKGQIDQIGKVLADPETTKKAAQAEASVMFDRFGGLDSEQKEAMMMNLATQRGYHGSKNRGSKDYDALVEDFLQERFGISGEKGSLGRGAFDAYSGALRGIKSLQGGMFAAMMANNQVINPMQQYASAYESRQAGRAEAMMRQGGMTFDEMMGTEFGTKRRRSGQMDAFSMSIGEQIYNTYAPIAGGEGSNTLGRNLGAISAIGGPALAAAMLGNSFAGPVGGLAAGLGVGIASTYQFASQAGNDYQGQGKALADAYSRYQETGENTYDISLGMARMFGTPEQKEAIGRSAETFYSLETMRTMENAGFVHEGQLYRRDDAMNGLGTIEGQAEYIRNTITPTDSTGRALTDAEIKGMITTETLDAMRDDGLIPAGEAGDTMGIQAMYTANRYMANESGTGVELYENQARIAKLEQAFGGQYTQTALSSLSASGLNQVDPAKITEAFEDFTAAIEEMQAQGMSQEQIGAIVQADTQARQAVNPYLANANLEGYDPLAFQNDPRLSSPFAMQRYNQAIATGAQTIIQNGGFEGQIFDNYRQQQDYLTQSGDLMGSNRYESQFQQAAAASSRIEAVYGGGMFGGEYLSGALSELSRLDQPRFNQAMAIQSGNVYATTMAHREAELSGETTGLGQGMYNLVDLGTGLNPYQVSIDASEAATLQQYDYAGYLQDQNLEGLSPIQMQRDMKLMQYQQADRQYEVGRQMNMAQYSAQFGGESVLKPLEGVTSEFANQLKNLSGGLKQTAELFQEFGFNFDMGDGRGYRQLEDEQIAISRAAGQRGFAQQEASFALNEQSMQMRWNQFFENLGFSKEKFDYQTGRQKEDMALDRGMQLKQRQWQAEDMSFQRSKSEIGFGWQMEDFDLSLRYARGMDRRKLMRDQERAVISQAMDRGKMDRDESRMGEQNQYNDEKFKRAMQDFNKSVEFQARAFEMQERHFREQYALDQQQFELSKQRFEQEKADQQALWAIEDQRRLLDRQFQEAQAAQQMKLAEDAQNTTVALREMGDLLTGIFEAAGNQSADFQAGVNTGSIVDDIFNTFKKWIPALGTGADANATPVENNESNQTVPALNPETVQTLTAANEQIQAAGTELTDVGQTLNQIAMSFIAKKGEITVMITQMKTFQQTQLSATKLFVESSAKITQTNAKMITSFVDGMNSQTKTIQTSAITVFTTINQGIQSIYATLKQAQAGAPVPAGPGSTGGPSSGSVWGDKTGSSKIITGKSEGGYIEKLAANIIPFNRGGYTGDGFKQESAGVDLLELHKGEYVVPQNGALVLRGADNMTADELREIRRLLQRLVDMGIYSVNAQIYTNDRSMKAADLNPYDAVFQSA